MSCKEYVQYVIDYLKLQNIHQNCSVVVLRGRCRVQLGKTYGRFQLYIYMCVYKCIHIYVYVYVYMYVYVCVCVCVYIYIYIYILFHILSPHDGLSQTLHRVSCALWQHLLYSISIQSFVSVDSKLPIHSSLPDSGNHKSVLCVCELVQYGI